MVVIYTDVMWYKCMECNVRDYTAINYSFTVFV